MLARNRRPPHGSRRRLELYRRPAAAARLQSLLHLYVRKSSRFALSFLQLTMPLSTDAKATRAVSVPTPAFYASRRTSLRSEIFLDGSESAHKAVIAFAVCTRAQLLLSQEDDRTTVISSTSDSSQERMRQRALIEAQGRLKVS